MLGEHAERAILVDWQATVEASVTTLLELDADCHTVREETNAWLIAVHEGRGAIEFRVSDRVLEAKLYDVAELEPIASASVAIPDGFEAAPRLASLKSFDGDLACLWFIARGLDENREDIEQCWAVGERSIAPIDPASKN